ncbi:hypothetical protein JCM15519_04040 [Fundidesulfovibrio butyratiphilus]
MNCPTTELIRVSFDPLDLSSARVMGEAASRFTVHINKSISLEDLLAGEHVRLVMELRRID